MSESLSTDRRPLHFETIEKLPEEIDRVVEADKAGKIRTLGAWTPGQILGHVAAWIEYGYVGYPMKRVPWLVRFYLRRQLKKYMKGGMPTGVRIPRVPEGAYGTEDMPTEQGRRASETGLGFLTVRDPSMVWLLYTLTALQTGISGFYFTARTAILPDVVEDRAVGTANAISSATWSVMLAVGAGAGGLVAGTMGIWNAYLVDSASFVISAAFIFQA